VADFIKGMELCSSFYSDCVALLMAKHFPGLQHSAARLGSGSDVLGFDTHQSRDHDWGPQVDLFLSREDYDRVGDDVYRTFARTLPLEFRGYSTHFDNDYLMGNTDRHPIVHRARVHTVDSFFRGYLGLNPDDGVSEVDWLRIPEQNLRTVQSGGVFHDGLGLLVPIREKLDWYPDDLWLYLMACQWRRIDQEEPFTARCGDVGDDLGSRVVASRQVREIMKLCLLMEREYSPYIKWFGTAFSRLPCAGRLSPLLSEVFVHTDWKAREQVLSKVYLLLAYMHNRLSVTEHIEPEISSFHDRPYLVPHSDRFVQALLDRVTSPLLKSMQRPIGSVSQFVDSTDVLCWPNTLEKISRVYRG
jgi:hypothetical protein